MSNAGPLTTTFTAPSSCATAAGLYQIWPASDTSNYYYEQGPLLSRTDCYPDSYDASPSQYYSPGLCPSGYTPACSSTVVVSTTATETAYTCCPTAAAYTCAGAADALTASSLSSYFGCTTSWDQPLALLSVTVISNGDTSVVLSTTEGAGEGLGANSIAVRFREGDFPTTSGATNGLASTTEASSLVTSDTGTLAIAVPTSTASSDSSASTSGKHAGVSTTQAIGIGVGSAGLVLIATAAAGLFLWIRRRKQRIRAQIETPIPPPAPPPKDRKFRAPPAPLNLDRARSHSYGNSSTSTTSSGIASVARSVNGKMIRGPFELGPHGKGKAGLFEMYGGGYRSQSQLGSSLKSADPTRSNTVTPSFWSPPPSYGSQPAELESTSSPQRSAASAASGYYRGRAELASP